MRQQFARLLAFAMLIPQGLFADFHYTETTQMTGGSMMNMMKVAGTFSRSSSQMNAPVVVNIYVKGNRMARIEKDTSEIVDLDKEAVTHVDHTKRQYYTITFQQMKERLEAAERQAASQPQQPAAKQPEPDKNVQMKFDVSVRNTGVHQQVSGLDTTESILSITAQATDQQSGQSGNLAVTSDLWMAPDIPGYDELRDFQRRYAQKLGEVYGSAITPMLNSLRSQMRPGTTQGFGEMAKETSKLKGMAIRTVMRMGSTADGKPLAAASEAPLPDSGQNAAMPSKGDMAEQGASNAATSAMANKLGGLGGMLGGFGHKKKQDAPPPADSATASQTQPASMVLMETTSEMGDFSSAPIDGSHFLPPAGYQQIPVPDLPAR
jgi:hypothetical protein